MIRVVHPGSRIRMLTFSHHGSRIQGSNQGNIMIGQTSQNKSNCRTIRCNLVVKQFKFQLAIINVCYWLVILAGSKKLRFYLALAAIYNIYEILKKIIS
jgi:hypothetical protein